MTLRRWWIKGLIQKSLCAIPGGKRVNDRLQTSIGGLRDFDGNIRNKVADWLGIVDCLKAAGHGEVQGRDILEIGTGWYSTLPFCFVLSGARHVITVDIHAHLHPDLTFAMLEALEVHAEKIAKAVNEPLEQVRQRLHEYRAAGDLEELLDLAPVTYQAPQLAQNLDWIEDASLDIIYSNSVLEHVAPDAIALMMHEASRLLRPGGIMVHAVACNDHFAHFDKRISFVNYLKFSERQWHFWNYPFHYQNRLRAQSFIDYARDAGFQILYEERAVRAGTREALQTMRVAPPFNCYSIEELAATTVNFVAVKSDTDKLPKTGHPARY